MHDHHPGVDRRFWIGAAWALALSAASVALTVGTWRLAFGTEPTRDACQTQMIFDSTTQSWVAFYSNCGPPSEHSGRDNASPS